MPCITQPSLQTSLTIIHHNWMKHFMKLHMTIFTKIEVIFKALDAVIFTA